MWVLLLLTLVGCGKAYDVPSNFQPYVDTFVAQAATEGVALTITSLRIEYGTLPASSEAGLCVASSPPTITLVETTWEAFDETSRQLLMDHELGHCVLGRVHNATTGSLTIPGVGFGPALPLSLMSPYLVRESLYTGRSAAYLHELFHPGEYL